MKRSKKRDWFEIKSSYYSQCKYPCLNCGRKMVIRYDEKSTLCSWCHDIIFRTKEEYELYNFKKKMFKELKKYD